MLKSIIIFLFTSFFGNSFAQQAFKLSSVESSMTIHGTSTLHDWQCRVEQTSGQLISAIEAQDPRDVKALTLIFPVQFIRSIDEKGAYYEKGMDKNIYKALQAEKFPVITFTLSKIVKRTLIGKDIAIDATGILKVAGVSKEIGLHTVASQIKGSIVFEGKMPLKMTDFNIDPPTAIFGTIKTGNEITLKFKMVYHALPVNK